MNSVLKKENIDPLKAFSTLDGRVFISSTCVMQFFKDNVKTYKTNGDAKQHLDNYILPLLIKSPHLYKQRMQFDIRDGDNQQIINYLKENKLITLHCVKNNIFYLYTTEIMELYIKSEYPKAIRKCNFDIIQIPFNLSNIVRGYFSEIKIEQETIKESISDPVIKFNPENLIYVPEAATIMGLSVSSVYRIIKKDPSFPAITTGVRRRMVDKIALYKWMEGRTGKIK